MRGCESVLCVSTGRMSAAQLGGREGGGQRRGDRAEDPEGKSAAAVTGAQNAGKLSGTGLSLERDGETKQGTFSLCRWARRLRAPAWAGAWMSAPALVTWCTVRSC